ncbi:MAG: hypothetical protein P9L99_04720 [Candidatus Lernaella stagnicola]|nr:hypothetical protein [Candidatus Lernaella stagnicola]
MKATVRLLGVVFCLCLLAGTAVAGDFMDTWVTFAFSDDNLFAGAEDRSPRAGFHYTGNETFFDNYNSAMTGYETLAHLVLYKKMQSYFERLELEAALVIQLENVTDEVTWETDTQLRDDGSYIKFNYLLSPDANRDMVALTLFPIDSDRFRLGYSYDISWGGDETWPSTDNPAPGLRLQWDWGTGSSDTFGGYLFGGAKAMRMLNEDINEAETFYGALGGFGLDFGKSLLWEVNGGIFEKGVFPPQSYDSEIAGETIEAHGVSTRVTWRRGLSIGDSVDFRLYRRDVEKAREAAAPEQYGEGFSHMLSSEVTYREQLMLDWDDPETTLYQPALAGDVNAKLKFGHWRVHTDLVFRQLAYVLFDVPGLAPFYALPTDATITDEYFVAAGFDYHIEAAHLTLGIIGGYKHPATYQGPTDVPGIANKQNIIVVRDVGDLEILPAGEDAMDIIAIKPTFKLELAEGFAVLGEVQYVIDENLTKYEDNENGIAERVFEEDKITHILGFNLLVQARF